MSELFKALHEGDHDRARQILNRIAQTAGRRAYRKTMDHCLETYPMVIAGWGLDDIQAAELITVPQSTWQRIKDADPQLELDDSQTGMISTLSLIYQRLHELFIDDMADRWPTLPNKGELFAGRTPVNAMTEYGFMKMRAVLDHIEHLQGA